jgi:sortase A
VIRRIGLGLAAAGVLLLLWVTVTLWRGDPITSLYTRYEQHALAGRLAEVESSAAVATIGGTRTTGGTSLRASIRRAAIGYRLSLKNGDPVGRIVIPRMHLKMVIVEGTTTGDLEKGPGHYNAASGESTNLPGMGGVIAIAGHRTTFLHPFRHIDELKAGDHIYLEMPYGTFRYTVYLHRVVEWNNWSILSRRPFEELVLSACHPLYSATHRWVVFARLDATARRATT